MRILLEDGTLLDTANTAIAVILSKKDKENISKMKADATVYAGFPQRVEGEKRKKFTEKAKAHDYGDCVEEEEE